MKHRTFSDMLEVVQKITSARPARSPDNLAITARLIQRLGLEDALRRMKYVHVAGTKGKGTVSVFTSALLASYGRRVGLFTSPHLVDIRERIQVNGALLPEETFARYFFDVYERHEALAQTSESEFDRDVASRANFFRLMFLTSLHAFASEGVDISVMEVGIGGRIDATNVISPVVCGITALGMDHMDILGNTVEEIASEKAGIMKPGVPCVSVPQKAHPSTRKVLQKTAAEVECPLIFLDEGVLPIRNWPRLAIGGEHVLENAKMALALARMASEIPVVLPLSPIEAGVLSTTTFLGRSQILHVNSRVTLYLDGAHTPESVAAAAKWFFESVAADPVSSGNRNVLLFYSTRDALALVKQFMPYVKSLTKCVLATIVSPKVVSSTAPSGASSTAPDASSATSAVSSVANSGESKDHLVPYIEAWRRLYVEVPCLPCISPFESFGALEELVCGTTGAKDDETVPVNVFVVGSFFLVGDVLKLAANQLPGVAQ